MSLFLSKLLPLFLYPLGLSLLLTGAACFLWRKQRAAVLGMLAFSFGLLWTASMPLVADYCLASLEWRYLPVPITDMPPAEAIVVLGGAVAGPKPPRLEVELSDAADRVLYAARLYRAGKAPVVIASGGTLPWASVPAEAPFIVTLLKEWGVPKEAVLLEAASPNTRDNALNSKRLADERGIRTVLLVTSAAHMPRAAATFETVGLRVIPAPTDYHVAYRDELNVFDLLPSADALAATTVSLKEYLGWLYYRWRGWIGG